MNRLIILRRWYKGNYAGRGGNGEIPWDGTKVKKEERAKYFTLLEPVRVFVFGSKPREKKECEVSQNAGPDK